MDWREAAIQALNDVTSISETARTPSPERSLEYIKEILEGLESAANSSDWNENLCAIDLTRIGTQAYYQCSNYGRDYIVDLLCQKQAAYGHENILAFGLTGLHVRTSDKVARIDNMINASKDFEWESLQDSWLDLVGYATIARMLQLETFTLELGDE